MRIAPTEKESLEKVKRGNALSRKLPDGGVDLLAFQGMRVRMAIHMGSSEGGIKGPSCRFVHHLTDLSWGGMILLSKPVAETLEGVLEQLGSSAQTAKEAASVPKLVCMGIHTFEDYTTPMEMFHIFNEPVRGRHIFWDDHSYKLRDSTVHALGFYDAPVQREGVPGQAVIVFANIAHMATVQKFSSAAFTEAVLEVHAVVGPLLMRHGGYNILPQREGYLMFAFQDPVKVALFHRDLQAGLLKVVWPERYKELQETRPVYDNGGGGGGSPGRLLYNGLTVSCGMSCGTVNKNLELGRAQFKGPTCNRAARVSGLAKGGSILMMEHEFLEFKKGFEAVEPSGLAYTVLFEQQKLKGVAGTPNIVRIDTDELTRHRVDYMKKQGGSAV